MKILLLCNKSPWPRQEGGPIAMYSMIRGLLDAGHQVKVIAANTNKYRVQPDTLPPQFAHETGIEFGDLDLRIKPLAAVVHLISGKSYHVSRFYNRSFEQKIIRALQGSKFDVVQFEMLYMAVYLPAVRQYSQAAVVLRAHNVEHKIWQRIAENCHSGFKRFYLNTLYRSLRRFEISVANQVDGIVAITPVDAAYFEKVAPQTRVISIPFGLSANEMPPMKPQPKDGGVFHIGSMNWFPNQEGVSWLVDKVWPRVRQRMPGIKLHLAGRYMPQWLLSLNGPDIVVDGEVPDVWAYMEQFSVMVVPLFSGSGIRIKIIEGMAAGKAIITTSIGAEGIRYAQGRDLLIAADADGFADAIVRLNMDRQLRQNLGENARQLVMREHENGILMGKLTHFYDGLAGHSMPG